MSGRVSFLIWGLIFLLSPLDRGPQSPWFNVAFLSAGCVGVYAALRRAWHKGVYSIRAPGVLLSLAGFVGWIWLSNFWTVAHYPTEFKSITYLAALLLTAASLAGEDAGQTERRLLWVLAGCAAVGLGVGFWQLVYDQHGIPLEGSRFWRAHGLFVWPNTFAGYLVLLWPVFFWVYLTRRSAWQTGLFGLLLILGNLGLALTYSRGGWLAFGLTSVGGNAYLLYRYRLFSTYRKKLTPLVLGLIAGWLVLFSLPGSHLTQRVGSLLQPDTFQRQDIWSHTIQLWLKRPWLGYGFRTFHVTNTQWLPPGVRWDFAHNDYLQILNELGGIGLGLFFLFLSMVLGWVRTCLRSPGTGAVAPGMALGLLGMMMHTVVDYHFYIPGLLFLFLWYVQGIIRQAGPPPRSWPVSSLPLSPALQKGVATILLALLFLYGWEPVLIHRWIQSAHVARNHHQYQPALTRLYRALALDPDREDVHYELAVTYSDSAYTLEEPLQKWTLLTQAEKEFTATTRLAPLTWNYWQARGEFYQRHLLRFIERGFPKEKLVTLDTTLAGWQDMWMTLPRMNAWYNRALRLYPNHPLLWKHRGETWLRFDEPDSSLVWFERYLDWDPRNASVRVAYGEALLRLERYRDSISQLRTVAAADSGYGYAWFLLGKNYLAINKLDSAKRVLEKAKRLNPGEEEVERLLHDLTADSP